jgi:uncharacterized protein (TIGR02421 family)
MDDQKKKSLLNSLKTGSHLNLNLSDGGKLKLERRLPFLLIYRNPDPTDRMTVRLVLGESSYLVASTRENYQTRIGETVRTIAKTLSNNYGAVMIMEIWLGEEGSKTFKIKGPKDKGPATIETLAKGLEEFCTSQVFLRVEIEFSIDRHPPHLEPIISIPQCQETGVFLIGLEIPPFFMDRKQDEFYYLEFRQFKSAFSRILRKTVYDFLRVQTTFEIQNFHVLGSTKVNSKVWDIDQQLFDIQRNFQFLMLISPINTNEAMREFIDNGYKGNPKFLYRLLPIDPDRLKEQLFKINIWEIEDPTLAFLFTEKREEVEKQITMLKERGTDNFKHSSIRLYNAVDIELYETAKHLLKEIPREEKYKGKWLNSEEMAEVCRAEIEYYQQYYPELDAKVEVKEDIVGMLVSKGQLYIGRNYQIPETRAEALAHHEIGTHVLTFYNGKIQPFQLLSIGLADYDELQEGIAVLSEYLVGGLSKNRLRTLAARVFAGHCLTEGLNFEETFNELTMTFDMDKESAFQISARIYQGGGCTKDIIYLRGLISLLDYLKAGGDLEILFVGKIALKHVPLINELQSRKVLKPTPLYPRYMKSEEAKRRLQKVKAGLTLLEMLD